MRTKVLLLCLALVALTGLAATRIDAATMAARASHSCRVYSHHDGLFCYRLCQCDDVTGKAFVCTIGEICMRIPDPPNLTRDGRRPEGARWASLAAGLGETGGALDGHFPRPEEMPAV